MTTNNNPKDNQIRLFFQIIALNILAIILCFLFNRCAAKPVQNTHTVEHIVQHKKDSVKVTTINKAILDSLIIQVAKVKTIKPECDSITQATLDQVLRQLNTRKKSGDNETGIYYNELKKLLVAWQKVGETSNEKITTNKATSDKSKEVEKVKIPVKYIPAWVKYLAYLGVAFILFLAWRISKIWF